MIRDTQRIMRNYPYVWMRSFLNFFRFLLAWVYGNRLKKTTCFVGISGSAGKTTTKDISANALQIAGGCFNTPKTQNYSHSIPKCLLRIRVRHQYMCT